MNPLKLRRLRYALIGYSGVCLVLLFVLRYQPFMNSPLIMLLFAPALIGVIVYNLAQIRMDIERKMGMKLVLLGSINKIGYFVAFGLIIAAAFVDPTNIKLVNGLRLTAIAVLILVIVASYMYQAGIKKWQAEQQDSADRSSGESSEDDPPEEV